MSDAKEELDFMEVSGNMGWENKLSGLADTDRLLGKGVNTLIRKVNPDRLDDLLESNNIDFDVDVLFLDVEGHEMEVLRSANWLHSTPNVIVVESTGTLKNQDELRAYVIDKGYRLFARIAIADDIFVLD